MDRMQPGTHGGGIDVRYAPIVSLLDGSLFGYTAMPYDARTNMPLTPAGFFTRSEEEGALYDNDRLFRELAIRNAAGEAGAVKLFIPVSARIVFDPRLHPGGTLNRLEAAGLRPEQVVLSFTDEMFEPAGTLHAAVRHYRTQGFRIELGGMAVDRASMERMASLKPDYVRIGKEWLPRGPKDAVGESLLAAVSALARKEKFVLIAGGVEREEQIRVLIAGGIGYGEGSWIGTGTERPPAVEERVASRIRQEMRRRFRGSAGSLAELAEPAITFPGHTPVMEIARSFEIHREVSGFVIVEDGKPVGMLMKDKLHRMLSRQFGLPLYGSRPVSKIMDAQPLIADISTPVDQLSQTAMAREPDKLYDAIIVTRGGEVAGIVSISALLDWVTNIRMSDAQWANPLTGLPGNEPIRRELHRRLDEGRPFSVFYADLDYFKWYNDQYGFHRGDDVIRFTSEVLQSVVRKYNPDDSFVGHIGGDDFIAVIDYGNPVRMGEEILAEFDRGIVSFLEPSQGPVRDRNGDPVEQARLSLSLALLSCQDPSGWTPERLSEYSARLKKSAKGKRGSALEWETLGGFSAAAANRG
ncbi:GGDEF domain-containing protein [Cohnella caldifontis]|uniref:GGDEF domain-containing protein n=1 Tax=Cohnella caldifontis TaxID=3027471 RepID=UPI0023EC4949|nr:GGDEF domain-containing protein [Cohnella sp. YIM B05605]